MNTTDTLQQLDNIVGRGLGTYHLHINPHMPSWLNHEPKDVRDYMKIDIDTEVNYYDSDAISPPIPPEVLEEMIKQDRIVELVLHRNTPIVPEDTYIYHYDIKGAVKIALDLVKNYSNIEYHNSP